MTELLHTAQWLISAQRDLTAAEALLPSVDELAPQVGFHAQQCAEKALKSVLRHREADIPRTHVLKDLVELLRSDGVHVPADIAAAGQLTTYAVEARYAESEDVTAEQAREAVRLAREVLAWARATIGVP